MKKPLYYQIIISVWYDVPLVASQTVEKRIFQWFAKALRFLTKSLNQESIKVD